MLTGGHTFLPTHGLNTILVSSTATSSVTYTSGANIRQLLKAPDMLGTWAHTPRTNRLVIYLNTRVQSNSAEMSCLCYKIYFLGQNNAYVEGFRNIYQMDTLSHTQPGKTGMPQPVHRTFIALNELWNELCLRNLSLSGTFV